MADAVILACARSPMTRAGRGAFAFTRIDDIGAQVIEHLLARVPGVDPGWIEDVIIGCAMPEGEQGMNIARNLAFLAGLPQAVGGVTVNRLCASSLSAINQAARAIRCEDGDLFLAGGVESMSHVPMGGFNPSLNEKLLKGDMPAAYISMGLTAENVARKYSISRNDQDHFALLSHRKAVAAQGQGKTEAEIVPIEACGSKGEKSVVMRDEGPRPDTSMEALAKLPPAFLEGGTVSAGNSSPLTDGAAMVLIASKKLARRLKIRPLARIRAAAVAGVDPAEMGMGPVLAVPKTLARARMKPSDIELIELNEAFAAQAVAVVRELGLDERRVNIHGGALALGHPLGMSGARIVTTLLAAMIDRGVSTGLATMCVGGGQGVATIIERT